MPNATDTLRNALTYMKHEPLCAIVGGYDQGCTCGRDAAALPLSQQVPQDGRQAIDLDALHADLVETLQGIVDSNWRAWAELGSPEEFERWAKSRANHAIAMIHKVQDTVHAGQANNAKDAE